MEAPWVVRVTATPGPPMPAQDTGQGAEVASVPTTSVSATFTPVPARRREIIYYTVQPGDTLFAIAEYFGLNPQTLVWCNPDVIHDIDVIYAGDTLLIPPEDGVYIEADGVRSIEEIAEYYGADAERVINYDLNGLQTASPNTILTEGTPLFIPGGRGDAVEYFTVVEGPRPEDSVAVGGPQSEYEEVLGSADATPGPGTPQFLSYAGMINVIPGHPGSCGPIRVEGYNSRWYFIVPVRGYYEITQRFKGRRHNGIDLAAERGTPVVAADDGVVVFAGWNNWGYGNMVVLYHNVEYMTLYAHMDTYLVRCGDYVQQGERIGTVGSTGHSTNNHLHFEIRDWYSAIDPETLLDFSR